MELGLEARTWQSAYLTSCTTSYLPSSDDVSTSEVADNKSDLGMLESFATRLSRVQEMRANCTSSSDSDNDQDVDKSYDEYVKSFNKSTDEKMSQALSLVSTSDKSTENKLIAFESPAAEFFHAREFQGLSATIDEGTTTRIQQGQFGIASEYEHIGQKREPKDNGDMNKHE